MRLILHLGVTTIQNTIGTSEHILEICDHALALAGYEVIDGDDDCIFIRHQDKHFEVKIIECADY